MSLGNEASGGEHSKEGGPGQLISPSLSAVGTGRGEAQRALVSKSCQSRRESPIQGAWAGGPAEGGVPEARWPVCLRA